MLGLETEYGLAIEGRGPTDQISDATDVIRAYPDDVFVGWDRQYESPRRDIRGFQVAHLNIDPEDAKFDVGRRVDPAQEQEANLIMPTGGRFYNDHGHPEYSTPECASPESLAYEDWRGDQIMLAAARVYSQKTGHEVRIYKNNTDFNGASYGTHENYLIPRRLSPERLIEGLVPYLVARTVLVGAGKTCGETLVDDRFQLSQRAQFFTELASVDTLYRRPIFNTRDEPHAAQGEWVRLHVICGDANRMPSVAAMKFHLVSWAVALLEIEKLPILQLSDPIDFFHRLSFDCDLKSEGKEAILIIRALLDNASRFLDMSAEESSYLGVYEGFLTTLEREDWDSLKGKLDWVAKRSILRVMEEDEPNLSVATRRAIDLEYSNIDPDQSLFDAWMAELGIDTIPAPIMNRTRARARALAVEHFPKELVSGCWHSLTFGRPNEEVQEVRLLPNGNYASLRADLGVESFIKQIQEVQP